jgi:two-component system chemotaxis response regulator CheB
MRKIRVLVAEDATVIRRVVCEALQESGQIEVVAAAVNGKHAVELFPTAQPDVAVLDMEMPEMNGIDTMAALRALRPTLPVIMFSALTQQGTAATMQALFRGANDYVAKPTARGGASGGLPALRERLRGELIPKIRALAGADVPAAPAVEAPRPVLREARTSRVDVVAFGCSTGGPAALRAVLCGLLGPPPVPVLVVQHISSTFSGLFAKGLAGHVPFPVTEARPDEVLLPGHVYVAPGDHHLTVQLDRNSARARLDQGPVVNSCRPSVDVLFRSVAQVYGTHALAVVLTGMGSDGLAGCKTVVERGGQVLIQDRASSVVWGMPGAVARAGLAHRTAALAELAPTLTRMLTVGRHGPAPTDPKRGLP